LIQISYLNSHLPADNQREKAFPSPAKTQSKVETRPEKNTPLTTGNQPVTDTDLLSHNSRDLFTSDSSKMSYGAWYTLGGTLGHLYSDLSHTSSIMGKSIWSPNKPTINSDDTPPWLQNVKMAPELPIMVTPTDNTLNASLDHPFHKTRADITTQPLETLGRITNICIHPAGISNTTKRTHDDFGYDRRCSAFRPAKSQSVDSKWHGTTDRQDTNLAKSSPTNEHELRRPKLLTNVFTGKAAHDIDTPDVT
jgi:hypothetical protein